MRGIRQRIHFDCLEGIPAPTAAYIDGILVSLLYFIIVDALGTFDLQGFLVAGPQEEITGFLIRRLSPRFYTEGGVIEHAVFRPAMPADIDHRILADGIFHRTLDGVRAGPEQAFQRVMDAVKRLSHI